MKHLILLFYFHKQLDTRGRRLYYATSFAESFTPGNNVPCFPVILNAVKEEEAFKRRHLIFVILLPQFSLLSVK